MAAEAEDAKAVHQEEDFNLVWKIEKPLDENREAFCLGFDKPNSIYYLWLMKKNGDIILYFFLGLICGAAIISSLERRKSRLVDLNSMKNDLNDGLTIDRVNLNSDLNNIYVDLNKSYASLKNEKSSKA